MKPGHAAGSIARPTPTATTQRIVVTVTDRQARRPGVVARVVHDTASEDGKVVEDTFD